MKKLNDLLSEYQQDLDEINNLSEEIYAKNFANYFNISKNLAGKLHNGKDISDSDLQDVLITVPLKLFEVSEALNKFRLSLEVLKAKIKDKKANLMKSAEMSFKQSDEKYTQAQLTKVIDQEISGDELLIKLYESVIKRVENEISYTKELIMSAKKIFTARTEELMPVQEVDVDKMKDIDLPEYSVESL